MKKARTAKIQESLSGGDFLENVYGYRGIETAAMMNITCRLVRLVPPVHSAA